MQCIKQKMGMPGLGGGEGAGLSWDLGVAGSVWPGIWVHRDWPEGKRLDWSLGTPGPAGGKGAE